MVYRIGADVGGTFTDVVVERIPQSGRTDAAIDDEAAEEVQYLSTKVLTTHEAPERGILDGIEAVSVEYGIDLAEVTQVIHGTTLATNALIERRGARTALVTTAGFRDVIETRTEGRFEQYDLNIVLPTPLIERRDRFVVTERLNARGEVLVPFDDDEAGRVVEKLRAGGYDAIAIGFLHSYVNGDHERRFRDLLHRELGDQIAVSLSCEVSPQMRELERFNTVCANAYVQPMMASYLRRLESGLADCGVRAPVHLIHSGGGLVDVETAAAFPVRLVESGPAGGAIFAAGLAARHRKDRILSFDMGGTTAKIALIEDQVPQTAKSFEVARTTRFKKGSGMTISIPVIEMIEIGAGGGSIAGVDVLGQIRVGPRSAGSEPGPAAYDLGGAEPTVTDANVQLGRLRPETFGASTISLSPEKAEAALRQHVGDPLGIDADTAAVGVAEIVDENMTNAARVHAVENGRDLADFAMIAFGGGAPLHAARLMDKLGIDELLVPEGAGVGSAIGFLLAPFSYEAVRSFYTSSESFDDRGVQGLLDELTEEAMGFVRQGTEAALSVEREVSMRYRGQGWEIPVAVPDGPFDQATAQALLRAFEQTYQRYFGRAIDGLAVETVSWAVRVASVTTPPRPVDRLDPSEPRPITSSRPLRDPTGGQTVEAAEVARADLNIGDTVAGPAIIVERQTTTIVGSGQVATVQADRTLLLHRVTPSPDAGLSATASSTGENS